MFAMSVFLSYMYFSFWVLLLINYYYYGSLEIFLKGHYIKQH